MKIKRMRVDERLIHGQILLKWMEETGCKEALFVDDEIAEDMVMKKILEMSFPSGYMCSILGIESFVELVERAGEEPCFVVVKKLATLYELFKRGVKLPAVNLGNIPYGKGKIKLTQGMYIKPEEKAYLSEISRETELFYQQVPDSEKVNVNFLLENKD